MHLLSQLIRALGEPAQLWTPSGDVAATNDRFNELLGLASDLDWAAEGRRFVDDPQLSVGGAKELTRKALAGSPVEIAALPYTPPIFATPSKQPESLRLFMRLRPLHDENGRLTHVLCTITEYATVTERIEHDLMRSQKMENVETLASSVAHEFNNIFTGIRGLTELIKDATPEESEVTEFADMIGKNITRGAELIEKLSSFAREMPHSLRRNMMSAYLKHVVPLLQLQVPKRVVLEVDAKTDGAVLMDVNRLDQALANLVGNARDATGGTGTVRITLSDSPAPEGDTEEQAWLRLDVEDSGPGIPEELYAKVADPFFTTKARGKSTGLGLSMTQRIVALHDGVMQIGRSESLGGAKVSIYLPVTIP